MQGAIHAVPATQTPRLWLDIGTSFRTLTKWDLEQNASLVVVGVDPLQSNIEHAYQPKTPRFVRIHGACLLEPVEPQRVLHAGQFRSASPPGMQGVPIRV